MKVLLDSNIFLEMILEQEKATEVRTLFERAENYDFFITDYSLHSVGLLLFRRNQHEMLEEFTKDLMAMAVQIISISLTDLGALARVSRMFKLDFDDAYQYVAAEKLQLTIVSFDSDFDRTERGRQSPAQLVA